MLKRKIEKWKEKKEKNGFLVNENFRSSETHLYKMNHKLQ